MPQPRVPTAILRARGSIGPGSHNPERFKEQGRDREPIPSGDIDPRPPTYFTKLEKRLWKRLLAIIPMGVLGNCDETLLELTAQLWAKLRERTIKPPEASLLLVTLGRLGMTPSDRSKVAVRPKQPKSPEEDPWAAFDKTQTHEA